MTEKSSTVLEASEDLEEVIFLRNREVFAASYSPPKMATLSVIVEDDETFEFVTKGATSPVKDVDDVYAEIHRVYTDAQMDLYYDIHTPRLITVKLYDVKDVWLHIYSPHRNLTWDKWKWLEQRCRRLCVLWNNCWVLMQDIESGEVRCDDRELLKTLLGFKQEIVGVRQELLESFQHLPDITPSTTSMMNGMVDRGLDWFRDIVKVFIKNGGQVPVTSRGMMEYFRDNIDKLDDDDFFLLTGHIEYRLGSRHSTLDEIIRNLDHWVNAHYATFPMSLKLVLHSQIFV